MRGAAYTNKIMAKKSNQMKYRGRMQAKIMAERAKNSVSAYGGLGAHGLDFGDPTVKGQGDKKKEYEVSFSGSAMQYAPQVQSEDEDEYLVNADMEEELKDELKGIDEEVKSQEEEVENDDSAAHTIPDDDQGYVEVLREKFGHETFREG